MFVYCAGIALTGAVLFERNFFLRLLIDFFVIFSPTLSYCGYTEYEDLEVPQFANNIAVQIQYSMAASNCLLVHHRERQSEQRYQTVNHLSC